MSTLKGNPQRPFNIRRACVLGAGVMGAQIAALLAAAGVRTYLLDLASTEPPKDPTQAKIVGKKFRNARSLVAIENLKALKPSPLFSQTVLANILPGNFDDDMSVIAECDWVIEAVVEKLDIKQSIHKRIAEYARPDCPITTNTSGISLSSIVDGLPEHYQSRFLGTHFFNPPRYMKLLEIIPHKNTDQTLQASLENWIEERLGKGIVHAFDTVNFIANRIGVFNMQAAFQAMNATGLNIETIDAITGKLMGRPSSATFRTADVVGIDTMLHVANNTYERAKDDPYRDYFKSPEWIMELVKGGALGQKSPDGRGFYSKSKDAKGQRVILAYRPEKKSYEEQNVKAFPWMDVAKKEQNLPKRLAYIFDQKDDGATFAWNLFKETLSYSALLVQDIADGSPKAIDDAIRWGFNWEIGPFELWQSIGYDALLKRMQSENVKLPAWAKPGVRFYENNSYTVLGKNKTQAIPQQPWNFHLPKSQNAEDKRVVQSTPFASLVDVGDGVACYTFHSKMNALNDSIIEQLQKSIALVGRDFSAMIVANEGDHFSAGADLKQIIELISKKDWTTIDRFIRNFQGATQLLKFASFPTVSCPHGLVLGGGCEVALHTSARVAAAETYAGLVEVGVGLIPAGGGTKELAIRCYDLMQIAERPDPMQFLQRAFLLIGMGRTSSSAQEAIEMGLFPKSTLVSISKDHIVLRGKMQALMMVKQGYVPATPQAAIKVLGDPGIQTFKMMLYNMQEQMQISAYDAFVGEQVATVLCGGAVDGGHSVSEQYLLDLERLAFVELCKQKKTFDRIEHMLKNGSPLRN